MVYPNQVEELGWLLISILFNKELALNHNFRNVFRFGVKNVHIILVFLQRKYNVWISAEFSVRVFNCHRAIDSIHLCKNKIHEKWPQNKLNEFDDFISKNSKNLAF